MQLKFARVLALPAVEDLEPSTMYMVRHPTQADYASIYLSNADGSAARRLPTIDDILALVPETAVQADKLTTPRNIAITGDGTWEVNFDGSADVSAALTLASTGIVAGSYFKVTVDAKGRATAGENPTTLAGFGITDAASVGDLQAHINDEDAHLNSSEREWLDSITVDAAEINFLAGVTSNVQDQLDGKQAALGFTPENAANKGVADGYASLNSAGQVPASQLPSYVDDVLEFDNLAAFPAEGEPDKIYIARDDSKAYRWTGSVYFQINSSVGHADTADTLFTSRLITITGDASWEVDFNGSQNVSAALTLATVTTAGAKVKPVVNAKGLVIDTEALLVSDIPTLNETTVEASASVALEASEW